MAACILVSPIAIAPDSLPGGTQYVTKTVRLAPLGDEHKLRIVEYLDAVEEEALSRQVRSRPAFIVPYGEIPFLKGVVEADERNMLALQLHRFALEYFAERPVPMAAFLFDGAAVTAHSVDEDGLRFREADAIALPNGAWEKHSAYLQFAYPAVSQAPAADVVIGRICRALRQGPTADGIIDLAIALECLVDAKLEIKFQFSLFHALINDSDPAARTAIFKRLQMLYDVRSLNVHGGKPGKSDQRKVTEVNEHWSDLISLSRTNLTYYVEFCRVHGAKAWADHLKALAVGGPRLQLGNGEHDQA
jgi:hypothetical protein